MCSNSNSRRSSSSNNELKLFLNFYVTIIEIWPSGGIFHLEM